MKIKFTMIIFMAFCLAASAQLVILCSGSQDVLSVGGDYGRAWLENNQAQSTQAASASQENNTNATLTGWGGKPKGNISVNSDLATPQKPTNPLPNWLGDSTLFGSDTGQMNTSAKVVTQPQPLFVNTYLRPVHQMDASFNQTVGSPTPDANGLINGWDADTYYAVGPALDNF